MANCRGGTVGLMIAYSGAAPAIVTATVTALEGRGWTVVRDDVNGMLTIS